MLCMCLQPTHILILIGFVYPISCVSWSRAALVDTKLTEALSTATQVFYLPGILLCGLSLEVYESLVVCI